MANAPTLRTPLDALFRPAYVVVWIALGTALWLSLAGPPGTGTDPAPAGQAVAEDWHGNVMRSGWRP